MTARACIGDSKTKTVAPSFNSTESHVDYFVSIQITCLLLNLGATSVFIILLRNLSMICIYYLTSILCIFLKLNWPVNDSYLFNQFGLKLILDVYFYNSQNFWNNSSWNWNEWWKSTRKYVGTFSHIWEVSSKI